MNDDHYRLQHPLSALGSIQLAVISVCSLVIAHIY